MALGAGTGSGQGRGGASRCPRRHRQGRGEELRAGDPGDAEESASGRLAHLPPKLSRVELQPARSNHARQRPGTEARMGVGDERFRRESDDADRPQRRDVPREPQQHRSGDRCENGRPHLGNARGSRPGPGYGGIRSIAIAQDKVFLPTSNAHMVALSARTGEILGNGALGVNIHRPAARSSSATRCCRESPAADGRRADGCYISAIDINTGKRVWRFYTIPREGEPGFDTWGKLPKDSRAGVETWIAGSYDPDLNLTYWGTAQSKPWSFLNRGDGHWTRRCMPTPRWH